MTRNTPRGRLARVAGLTTFAGLLFAVACDTPFPSGPDEETNIAADLDPKQAEWLYVDVRYCEVIEKAGLECDDLTIDRRLSPTKWRYITTTKALHSIHVVPTVETPDIVRRSAIAGAAQRMWSPNGRPFFFMKAGDALRWERVATVKARLHALQEHQQ